MNIKKDWKVYAVIAAFVIIVIIVIYKWGKKSTQNTYIKNIEDNINRNNLSYSPETYDGLADRIEEAIKGAGTDEEAVFSVINQMKTKDDWLKLLLSFGVRDYGTFGKNLKGLVTWLQGDLDQDEFIKIQEKLKSLGVTI